MTSRLHSLVFAIIVCLNPVSLLLAGTVAQEKPEVESQDPPVLESAFLWKIESPDRKEPSYLFGTIHIPDERVLQFNQVVIDSFNESDEFYAELEMDNMLAMSAGLMKVAMLPDGKTLKDVLPEQLYSDLDSYFAGKGLPFAGVERFKPFMIEMTLQQLEMMPMLMAGAEPLDGVLYNRAKAAGKKTGGIETMDEQITALTVLDGPESVQSLEMTLESMKDYEADGTSMLKVLTDAYCTGDSEQITEVMMDNFDPSVAWQAKSMKALLDDRNKVMAERIARKLRAAPDTTFFFAFGAAHFIGDNSVNSFLQKDGFTVTRLTPPADSKPAEDTQPGASSTQPPLKKAG